MPMRIRGDEPMATDGFDASEGLLTSYELARLFGVEIKTVQRWASAAIAAQINGTAPKVPVMRTPGGDWRFSAKWARERQEQSHG